MKELIARKEYDDIIIGGGIAGLTCAGYLAKAGRKVAVFEKSAKPGGCCSSFMKEGFSFAPSVHWLSFCREDQVIGKAVKDLGVSDVVQFAYFNPLVRFIDEKSDITLSFDIPGMKQQLKKLYPEDSKGIDDFFETCAEFIKELNAMLEDSLSMVTSFDRLKFGIKFLSGKYKVAMKNRKVPANQFLRRYFTNENLIKIFYNMGPGDANAEIFPILARVGWAIDKNYYYIKEGNNIRLAEAFAAGVTRNGGEIIYNCEIKKILIENKKVVGIMDQNNNLYHAKNIISDIDGRTTYFKLIGKENLSPKFFKVIENKQPYSSSFAVNLGTDLELEKMGFSGESITYIPTNKPEDINDPATCKIVIQFRSLRDRTLAPEGKHVVMITARFPYDYKNYWTTGGSGIKGEKYYLLKEEIAAQLIKTAAKIIPGLSEHILVKDVATPLTFENFTGNYQGAIMGWREGNISLPKLPIKNFYQVGHWTFPGGSMNRVIACGRNGAKIILKKRESDKKSGNSTGVLERSF